MCDIHQLASLDLGMAPFDPASETSWVELGMAAQRTIHRVQDEVQEVGFIIRVGAPHRDDDPI
jgi:hypothetical protein